MPSHIALTFSSSLLETNGRALLPPPLNVQRPALMPLNIGFVGVATPLTAGWWEEDTAKNGQARRHALYTLPRQPSPLPLPELTSAFAAFLDAEVDAAATADAAPDPPYAAPLLLAPPPKAEESRRSASDDAPAGAEVVADLTGEWNESERERAITHFSFLNHHHHPTYPPALASHADIVFLYLPTDAALTVAIKALTAAPRPQGRPPLAVVLLAGASAAALAAATKANKACLLATAHIAGGGDAARRLALVTFVAGASLPRTAAAALLAPLCADVVDLGEDAGAGAALAAASALLTAGLLEATAEAMTAAEALRVPRARALVARLAAELAGTVGAALSLGPASAARRMADPASRPAPPDAAVAELVDAVKHGVAAAKAVKAPVAAAAAAATHLQQVEESGGGHLDAAALVAAVRDAAGVAP